MAEYVVVDPSASSYAIARAGLTSLSYALFFILVISLRFASLRLFLLLPVLLLAAGMISLRILHLDGTIAGIFPGRSASVLFPFNSALVYITGRLPHSIWACSHRPTLRPHYAFSKHHRGYSHSRATTTPGIILTLAWVTAIFLH